MDGRNTVHTPKLSFNTGDRISRYNDGSCLLKGGILPSGTLYQSVNGYTIATEQPEMVVNGPGNTSWRIRRPVGDDWTYVSGQQFWSDRFAMPFKLLNYHIDSGYWDVEWIHNWNESEIITASENSISVSNSNFNYDFATFINETAIDEQPEFEAEYTNYELNEPFYYGGFVYVVMEENGFYVYGPGQVWLSQREACEYMLGNQAPCELFGSHSAFVCEWIEPEPESEYDEEYNDHDSDEMNDGYSVEEEENMDHRATTPMIATNIGRTVPFISFEQEFSGNGSLVARKLYEMGYASSRGVEGYHNSDGRFNSDSSRFCYVETDSSCGYELIFDRVELNRRGQAERISEVQSILRDLRNDGYINLSARCGFHVHVDVSDWGMKEIVSGYHLWNYLEDPIFRFASAFWGSHRDEEVGGGYSTPVPKGYTQRTVIGRTLSSRRDALNFSPILNARGNCSCSAALYEDWANCTCNVRQPTLEFRVFNATLNQRKIRAYLAFCVAFVNIAKTAEFEPANFPEMRWQGTFTKRGIDAKSWEECSAERLKFILKEFPLTGAEKIDIQYCLRNSSLDSVIELI
ncbi:MAG: amidoligase family protein [Nitrososphaerales archaeon]